MIAIPGLDGLTQARRLDEVERMAREYIAVTLDIPLSEVSVTVSGVEVAGQDVLATKTLVEDLRRYTGELEQFVADLTRQFASALSAEKVPVRDVSTVLGVSHQRVSQLVQAADGQKRSTLADVLETAQAEHQHDLTVRLAPGQAPVVLEVQPSKGLGERARTNPAKAPAEPRPESPRPGAPTAPAFTPAIGRKSIAGRPGTRKRKANAR
ncbi:hypothetical protein [Kribbella amoyensis]|nr:hypothetical protein [Kribbella amoyensis]